MRKGPAITTLVVLLAGASLTTGVFATQGTIFHRLHEVDAASSASRVRLANLENQLAATRTRLDERWAHVDVALRAARPIRHEVNDALVSWLSAFRHARRVSESPVAQEDTRRLLSHAATKALPSSLDDIDVIRRADQEREAFVGLVGQRASLTTELARNQALVVASSEQRRQFVDGAKSQGASADLQQTADTMTQTLSTIQPAAPEFDFHRFKGTLARPVRGEVAHRFGASAPLVRPGGWTWRPEVGSEVRAIGAGEVVYVGSVEGWGLVAVVDHGGPHRSIYAHLQDVQARTGDRVERADVIATVGESGSLDGPRFYLELRDGSAPVDPAPWFLQIE